MHFINVIYMPREYLTSSNDKFIIKIKISFEAYTNNNYSKNKQYNEEHQYHNFFHATLCIVNINITCLDTFILKIKINKNKNHFHGIYERQFIIKIIKNRYISEYTAIKSILSFSENRILAI